MSILLAPSLALTSCPPLRDLTTPSTPLDPALQKSKKEPTPPPPPSSSSSSESSDSSSEESSSDEETPAVVVKKVAEKASKKAEPVVKAAVSFFLSLSCVELQGWKERVRRAE